MEEEQLQSTPELTSEPVPDNVGQPDPAPAETDDNAPAENPVNTGLPEPTPEPGIDSNYENLEKNDADGEAEDQTVSDSDGETDNGEEMEGDGSVTNITIVRPPAQIMYNTSADTEATYHVTVENGAAAPVPVLVTETLIEPSPGIMDKKLEDYSVTEALLLLILLTLWLRMIFDYFGRRKS